MRVYLLKRLLWMVPTLLGISMVTFLLMELAPGDRALREAGAQGEVTANDLRDRAERVLRLRKLHGLVDPVTGETLPLARRYLRWLGNAVGLRFSGEVGDDRLGRAVRDALPVTMLVNALALLLALAVAIPLGARAGMKRDGGLDRAVSGLAFVVYGVPEFLLATILLLLLGGGFFAPVLPSVGLQSDDAAHLSLPGRVADVLLHLALPVGTLALGYAALLFRFLRESVGRAARSEFARALRGFGMPAAAVRRRVLRNGLSPVITLLGSMLPVLVGGTVVVETIFALPGIGQLTVQAVGDRDMPMVMALTMLVSVATLLSFILSDVLQRVVDPRVELR